MVLLELIYLLFVPHATLLNTIALSFICAGGFSNLFDRIAYNGYVVDFFNIGINGLRTGIFNVADVAIMAGAFLLLFASTHSKKTGAGR